MANFSLFAEIHEPTRGIGAGSAFPWGPYRLTPDIELLRQIAEEKTVIVGRRTHLDIQGELPEDCFPIVLTNDLKIDTRRPNHLRTAHSIGEAFTLIDDFPVDVVVVGGGSIFRLFLPHVTDLYLTLIHGRTLVEPDCFFPSFEHDFMLEHEGRACCFDGLSYRQCRYSRIRPSRLN